MKSSKKLISAHGGPTLLTIVCGCWLAGATWAHQHDGPVLRHANYSSGAPLGSHANHNNYSGNFNNNNHNSNNFNNNNHNSNNFNNNNHNDNHNEHELHEAASKLQLLQRISHNLDRHQQSLNKRDLINAQLMHANADQLAPEFNSQNSDTNNNNRLISAILIQNLLGGQQQQQHQDANNHRISERYVNVTSQSSGSADNLTNARNAQQRHQHQASEPHLQQLGGAARARDDADQAARQQQQQQRILSNKWINLERSFEQSIDSAASYMAPLIGLALANSSSPVGGSCKQALLDVMRDGRDERAVLAQMLDASAKLPSGILEGTLTELGNYDECLRITSGKLSVRGAYCTIQIKPPLPARPRLHTICQKQLIGSVANASQANRIVRHLAQHSHEFHYVGLRMGLCVPSKCTKSDIHSLLVAHLSQHELSVDVKSCQTMAARGVTYDNYQLSIMSTFAFITLLVILGTLYETCSHTGYNSGQSPAIYHGPAGQHSMVALTKERAKGDNVALATARKEAPSMLLYSDFVSDPTATGKRQQPKRTGWLGSVLLCFSLMRNCQQLVRVKHHKHRATTSAASEAGSSVDAAMVAPSADPPTEDLQVIHGLRVVTMTWIIFSHSIGLVNPEMMSNLFALSQLSCTSLPLQALLNGTLAVNTFFMISGLVTAISFARKCLQSTTTTPPPTSCTTTADSNNLLLLRHQLMTATAINKQQVALGSGANSDTTNVKLINDNSDTSSSPSLSQASSRRSSNGQAAASGAQNGTTVSANNATTDFGRHIGHSAPLIESPLIESPDSESGPCRSSLSSGSTVTAASSTASSPARATLRHQQTKFQPLLWLAMRYVRLTPTYAVIIGASIVLPLAGSGPFWQETVDSLSENCRHNWWKNLLYVNNFLDTNKLCLIHSWYLSNDFQFHLVALALFGLYLRSRRVALGALTALLVTGSLATAYLSIVNNFPPTIVTTSPAVMERWTFIHSLYYKPWPHLASYLVGLLTGYCIVATNNGSRLRPAAPLRLVGWLVSGSLALAVLNSIYPWNMGWRVDPLLTGLHSATFRTIWSACVAWLVYVAATSASTTDNNPFNKMLSWHGFQLASRLTYGAYLVHPLVIYYHFGSLTERLDSSMFAQFHRFMANWIITYVLAFLLALFVETPSLKLQQLLMNSCSAPKRCSLIHETTQSPQRHNSKRWSASNSDIVTCTSTTTSNLHITAGNSTTETSENGSIVDNNGISTQSNNLDNLISENSKSPTADHGNHDAMGAKQTLTKQPIVTCNGKHLPEAIALDTDFQLKLSRAISRGFKMRSQMVEQKLTSKPPLGPIQISAGQSAGQEGTGQTHHASGQLSKPRRRQQHHAATASKQQRENDQLMFENDGQRGEKLLAPLSARKDAPRKNRAMAKVGLSLDNYHHNHHHNYHLNNNTVIYDGFTLSNAQQRHNLPDANIINQLNRHDLDHISMATHNSNNGGGHRHQDDIQHLSQVSLNY